MEIVRWFLKEIDLGREVLDVGGFWKVVIYYLLLGDKFIGDIFLIGRGGLGVCGNFLEKNLVRLVLICRIVLYFLN